MEDGWQTHSNNKGKAEAEAVVFSNFPDPRGGTFPKSVADLALKHHLCMLALKHHLCMLCLRARSATDLGNVPPRGSRKLLNTTASASALLALVVGVGLPPILHPPLGSPAHTPTCDVPSSRRTLKRVSTLEAGLLS